MKALEFHWKSQVCVVVLKYFGLDDPTWTSSSCSPCGTSFLQSAKQVFVCDLNPAVGPSTVVFCFFFMFFLLLFVAIF